jgi:hypothetical protein
MRLLLISLAAASALSGAAITTASAMPAPAAVVDTSQVTDVAMRHHRRMHRTHAMRPMRMNRSRMMRRNPGVEGTPGNGNPSIRDGSQT